MRATLQALLQQLRDLSQYLSRRNPIASKSDAPSNSIPNLPALPVREDFDPDPGDPLAQQQAKITSVFTEAAEREAKRKRQIQHTYLPICRNINQDVLRRAVEFRSVDYLCLEARIVQAYQARDYASIRSLLQTIPSNRMLRFSHELIQGFEDHSRPTIDAALIVSDTIRCNGGQLLPRQMALLIGDAELYFQIGLSNAAALTRLDDLPFAVCGENPALLESALRKRSGAGDAEESALLALLNVIKGRDHGTLRALLHAEPRFKHLEPGEYDHPLRAAIRAGDVELLRLLQAHEWQLCLDDEYYLPGYGGLSHLYMQDAAGSGEVKMLHELLENAINIQSVSSGLVTRACFRLYDHEMRPDFFREYMQISGNRNPRERTVAAIVASNLAELQEHLPPSKVSDERLDMKGFPDLGAVAAESRAWNCLAYLQENGYVVYFSGRSALCSAGHYLSGQDRRTELLELCAAFPGQKAEILARSLHAVELLRTHATEQTRWLLEQGASAETACLPEIPDGNTPSLLLEAILKNPEVARILLAAGARLAKAEYSDVVGRLRDIWNSKEDQIDLLRAAEAVPDSLMVHARQLPRYEEDGVRLWFQSLLGASTFNTTTQAHPDFADALLLQSIYLRRPEETRIALELGANADRPLEMQDEISARTEAKRLNYSLFD